MQCRGSRRAFTTAGEESGFMPGYGMKRGSRIVLFLVAHALRRSQFSPSESLLRPSLRFRSVFPVENFTMRKFSTGNRRENAESRRDGRTLMRKGKIVRFVNTIPQMASHISFSIFSSLWDRISMSLLIFWLVIRAYIWVVFKSVCPKRRLTVSMGTPCESSTVVAFVCRAT